MQIFVKISSATKVENLPFSDKSAELATLFVELLIEKKLRIFHEKNLSFVENETTELPVLTKILAFFENFWRFSELSRKKRCLKSKQTCKQTKFQFFS